MLERLVVRNLVVIREAELELGPGLTVVTGETGAGKTVLLGALGLVLGARGDAALVGPHAEEAWVEATFAVDPGLLADEAFDGIRELVSDDEEDPLVLARRLGADGRGRALVCGRAATRGGLEEAGARLVGVVSQHEARSLGRPAVQRRLLDSFLGAEQEARLQAMAASWRALQEARRLRAAAAAEAGDAERLVEDLRALIERVEQVAPEPGEEEALRAERERLRHADLLAQASGAAAALLTPDDEAGALDLAARALRALEPGRAVDPALEAIGTELAEAVVGLEEAARSLHGYAAGVEHDPLRLDAIEERLERLADLARRHGSVAEAVAAAAAARERLERLEEGEAGLAQLAGVENEAEAACTAAAAALSAARREGAPLLAAAVQLHLGDLGMADARVAVELGERALGPAGGDDVVLLVAPNPGIAPAPIAQAASGGELSRLALALRVAAHDQDRARTLVFDEVDAGVGGRTANAVGEKLAALAAATQVICITHLPQIAARADRHFRVVKEPGDPTVTRIERLRGADADAELARMLGGEDGGSEALELARALRASPVEGA